MYNKSKYKLLMTLLIIHRQSFSLILNKDTFIKNDNNKINFKFLGK